MSYTATTVSVVKNSSLVFFLIRTNECPATPGTPTSIQTPVFSQRRVETAGAALLMYAHPRRCGT